MDASESVVIFSNLLATRGSEQTIKDLLAEVMAFYADCPTNARIFVDLFVDA